MIKFANQIKLNQSAFLLLFLITGWATLANAGNREIDSLSSSLKNASGKTEKGQLFIELGKAYQVKKNDSALLFYDKAEQLALKNGNQPLWIRAKAGKASWFSYASMLDTAEYIISIALPKAKKINDKPSLAYCFNALGFVEYKRGNYSQSEEYFTKAVEFSSDSGEKELESKIWNRLGLTYKRLGKYDEALTSFFNSLLLDEENNDIRGQGITLSNIGLLYERLAKPDLALDYLNRSLLIREKTNNALGKSFVLNNIGLVYEGLNDYNNALKYYQKAMVIKDSLGDKAGVAKLYSNMGIVYVGMKNYNQAIDYFKKAMDMRIGMNNISGAAHTTVNIAQLYETKGDYTRALDYYDKGFAMADQLNDIHQKRRIYIGYSTCYDSLGYYKKALKYYKKYYTLKDSLFSLEKEKNINKLEIKYQTLQKEKENQTLLHEAVLNKQKIKRQSLFGFLLILLLLVFIILVIVIIYSRKRIKKALDLVSKQKQELSIQAGQLEENNQKLQELIGFKEDVTNMVVHDLKNPLNVIRNVNKLTNYPQKQVMIEHASMQMNHLIMNLLDVHKMEEAMLELHYNDFWLDDLIEKIVHSLSIYVSQKSIAIKNTMEANYLVHADVQIIERVLTNLLVNGIKFSPQGESLEIQSNQIDENKVEIHIVDKGPGIDPEKAEQVFTPYNQIEKLDLGFDGSTGIGLTFCKMAMDAHGESIGLHSANGKGADFYITLPFKNKKQHLLSNGSGEGINIPEIKPQYKSEMLPYIEKIEALGIYQVTKTRKILELIPKTTEEIAEFCNQMEETILNCNHKRFEYLIKAIKK